MVKVKRAAKRRHRSSKQCAPFARSDNAAIRTKWRNATGDAQAGRQIRKCFGKNTHIMNHSIFYIIGVIVVVVIILKFIGLW
jgi:hypothetical protein